VQIRYCVSNDEHLCKPSSSEQVREGPLLFFIFNKGIGQVGISESRARD